MMAVITRTTPGQTESLGNILLMPLIVPHPTHRRCTTSNNGKGPA